MNIDTILKLLYRNGLENVVTRAIQIENSVPFKHNISEELLIELTNSNIKSMGMKFKGDRSYGYLKCPIVGIDIYDLDKPYIVTLPDGSVKKVSGNDDNRLEPTEVVAIEIIPIPSPINIV